jgi:hypothetical protein
MKNRSQGPVALAPIVFLDIDGVLSIKQRPAQLAVTRYRTALRSAGLPVPPIHQPVVRILVASSIAALNRLVQETGASLVLCSEWRKREGVRLVLEEAGVVAAFHADWRTDWVGPQRVDELRRWLARHAMPPFVVLDDWSKALLGLEEHTVVPDYRVGLTEDDCDRATQILRRQIDERAA